MALQLGALRDALLSAGASPEKAAAAAEEVAEHCRQRRSPGTLLGITASLLVMTAVLLVMVLVLVVKAYSP